MNIVFAVLTACVTVPDLKAIIEQYSSEKDGKASLLQILVGAEIECCGHEGVTLVLKRLTRVCV